jgi:hypothetical protein
MAKRLWGGSKSGQPKQSAAGISRQFWMTDGASAGAPNLDVLESPRGYLSSGILCRDV